MQLSPDQNNQAQELYFSKNAGNQILRDVIFNKNNVVLSPSLKHLAACFTAAQTLMSTYRVKQINALR